MKLYYSPGSPFARKVRILLAEKGLEYEKDELAALRPAKDFGQINPNLAVPVLIDGNIQLFESNLILEYILRTYPEQGPNSPSPPLASTLNRPEFYWEDAKIIAVLETMANSIVNIRISKLVDGMEVRDFKYLQRQEARIQHCLDWLEERATPEGFAPGVFSFQDINLLCPLRYADLREVIEWRGRPKLEALIKFYDERPSVTSTDLL
jgi:glutathione S-transferase